MSAEVIALIPMSELPNRILEQRKARGVSQDVLANIIGVTKMTISRLERGINEPTLTQLRQIANFFGCAVADLLSDDDNPDRLDSANKELFARLRHGTDEQRENIRKVAEALIPYDPAPRRDVA
jgi:transcriptional regulator with XRE-family HTH domain